MLVDRRLLQYNDKISLHWPEFGDFGKADITIADVLRHESGLAKFNNYTHSVDDTLRENIKSNSIGQVIQNCELKFPEVASGREQTTREYHASTRGFILNEIIRRVDPHKR